MNIADIIKKQTDSILRQRSQGPMGGSAVIVRREDGETKVTTPGTTQLDLEDHKVSGDHDDRYSLISDLEDHKVSGDHDDRYPYFLRRYFNNVDSIVIEHNFGRRPNVQIIGDAGNLIYGAGSYGAGSYSGRISRSVITPVSIIHDSVNQVTIMLSGNDSGEVVLIG